MFPFTTHGFCPPIIMGDFNLKICWNFAGPHVFLKSFFLNFFSENLFFNFFINLYGESNILWLHFHYFIYLETYRSTQKSEVFLLTISSGYVNASGVVTCQYLLILFRTIWNYYLIAVIKILEKYLWRSSVLERNI